MQRINPRLMQNISALSRMKMSNDSGSRGSKGSAGAIRDAGGAFAQMEAAHENQYFYNQQKEQLRKLKEGLTDEIAFHEEQIRRHQEAIERHKTRMDEMHKTNDK
ncbi:PREDICTED: ATPase inhibitor mai-2, mitochondrial-like [Polistes canadensis]|uniref:ATPase inhibitor mai-2, mitochondrial-like n=1 Tax=Polistes canadensis TaxID=91411 RepID=UPI000718B958|nr:PREDICTED: ATPase inhibitor mai-2, mitochondrial-like [Polistes canadensis]